MLFRAVGAERAQVVGNVTGSRRRLALAFGVSEQELTQETLRRLANPIAPIEVSSREAPVQEVVLKGDDADLTLPPGTPAARFRWWRVYFSEYRRLRVSGWQATEYRLPTSYASRSQARGRRPFGAQRSPRRIFAPGRPGETYADCFCDRIPSGRQYRGCQYDAG